MAFRLTAQLAMYPVPGDNESSEAVLVDIDEGVQINFIHRTDSFYVSEIDREAAVGIKREF
jgi:hypothetical protein